MGMRRLRWDPFRELEDISCRLDRFLARHEAGRSSGDEPATMTDWTPPVDIREMDRDFHIIAELPGVRKEDLHVMAEDDLLIINGERRDEGQRIRRYA